MLLTKYRNTDHSDTHLSTPLVYNTFPPQVLSHPFSDPQLSYHIRTNCASGPHRSNSALDEQVVCSRAALREPMELATKFATK